ncbi:MAG: hypothetical protein HYS22_03290 [Deltaproteobacteria bacterium]|nr:hypothetical protein [Deltaproteobacteria bacterium]
MNDIPRDQIPPWLSFFHLIALGHNPTALERSDYDTLREAYAGQGIDVRNLPSYEEIQRAFEEAQRTRYTNADRLIELNRKIGRDLVCRGGPDQAARFFGPEVLRQVGPACEDLLEQVVPQPVKSLSRPVGREIDPEGVAVVVGTGGALLFLVWKGRRLGDAATKGTEWVARRLNSPVVSRFAEQVVKVPPSLAPAGAGFWAAWGHRLKTAWNIVSHPRLLFRTAGVFAAVGLANEATRKTLGYKDNGLTDSVVTVVWYVNGFNMAIRPDRSRLLRLARFAVNETGLASVGTAVSTRLAVATGGRLMAGRLLAGAGTGTLVVMGADMLAVPIVEKGVRRFANLPDTTRPIEDQLVMAERRDQRVWSDWMAPWPYAIEAAHFLAPGSANLAQRSDFDWLYTYFRYQDLLGRLGARLHEEAVGMAVSRSLAEKKNPEVVVDYDHLKRVVEDPEQGGGLWPWLRQMLEQPIPYQRWGQYDPQEYGYENISGLLAEAIAWDETKGLIVVKNDWAFRQWVDSLPVPGKARETLDWHQLQKRGFRPIYLMADEIGELGRRGKGKGRPLTLGQLHEAARRLDAFMAKPGTAEKVLEIISLMAEGKKPEEGRYAQEEVYSATELWYVNQALDTLYRSATGVRPSLLDQEWRRPRKLADRVVDLANNAFGFPGGTESWKDHILILQEALLDPSDPAATPYGPAVGWVEMPNGYGMIYEGAVHLLETPVRQLWMDQSPAYAYKLFETIPFRKMIPATLSRLQSERDRLREGTRKTIAEIEAAVRDNRERIRDDAETKKEFAIDEKTPEEEALYRVYRGMAGSSFNNGDLFGQTVLKAAALGLDGGLVLAWEKRLTAEQMGEVVFQTRTMARLSKRGLGESAFKRENITDAEIEFETYAALSAQPVSPESSDILNRYYFNHLLEKAEAFGLETGELGLLERRWRALHLLAQLPTGSYLSDIPPEARSVVRDRDLKEGLVVSDEKGAIILNQNSPEVQVMQALYGKLKGETDRLQALLATIERRAGIPLETLHDQEIRNAAVREGIPLTEEQLQDPPENLMTLTVGMYPTGVVATTLALLQHHEHFRFLGLSPEGEQE